VDASNTQHAPLVLTLCRLAEDKFREGNGRAQRILTEHIAEHAGYLLDWHRISPDEQNFVAAQASDGELEPLRGALERAMLPIFRGGVVDESPWPTNPIGPARASDSWQLDKPRHQVLADARAQAARPAQQLPPPRPQPPSSSRTSAACSRFRTATRRPMTTALSHDVPIQNSSTSVEPTPSKSTARRRPTSPIPR
jgi:hypothetical protein